MTDKEYLPLTGSGAGGELAQEICEVLGIKHCCGLNLDFQRRGVFTVTATVTIREPEMDKIVKVLKKYELRIGKEICSEDVTDEYSENVVNAQDGIPSQGEISDA